MSWPKAVTWLSGRRFLLLLVVPLHRRFVGTQCLYNSGSLRGSVCEAPIEARLSSWPDEGWWSFAKMHSAQGCPPGGQPALYLVGWYQDLFDIAEVPEFEYEKCRGEIRPGQRRASPPPVGCRWWCLGQYCAAHKYVPPVVRLPPPCEAPLLVPSSEWAGRSAEGGTLLLFLLELQQWCWFAGSQNCCLGCPCWNFWFEDRS